MVVCLVDKRTVSKRQNIATKEKRKVTDGRGVLKIAQSSYEDALRPWPLVQSTPISDSDFCNPNSGSGCRCTQRFALGCHLPSTNLLGRRIELEAIGIV